MSCEFIDNRREGFEEKEGKLFEARGRLSSRRAPALPVAQPSCLSLIIPACLARIPHLQVAGSFSSFSSSAAGSRYWSNNETMLITLRHPTVEPSMP